MALLFFVVVRVHVVVLVIVVFSVCVVARLVCDVPLMWSQARVNQNLKRKT